MKTLVLSLFVCLLFVSNSFAQNFEGTIKYKLEYAGEMAAQMAAFAPNSMEYTTQGSNTRFALSGGMASMLGTFIIKGKEDVMYNINDSEKKAYKMPLEKSEEKVTPKVTKEKGTQKILGYTCHKYSVVTTAQGQEIKQTVWACKDIKITKPKGGENAGGNLHIEGVEGFPLKTVAVANVMGMSITTTTIATEVDKNKPKKAAFETPKGYEVEETTMQELMGKMMGGFGK